MTRCHEIVTVTLIVGIDNEVLHTNHQFFKPSIGNDSFIPLRYKLGAYVLIVLNSFISFRSRGLKRFKYFFSPLTFWVPFKDTNDGTQLQNKQYLICMVIDPNDNK